MEKLKTITLTALCMLLTFGIVAFYSCDKEPKGGDKIELTIHNPYDFEVRLEIEGVLACDRDKNPNYDSFSPPHKPLYPAPAHLACIVPEKDEYWDQLNLGPGTMQVITDLGTRKIKIRAYNYKDKDTKGGEEVGELSFKGKFGKKYEWTVGYDNSVEEIVPPPPSSGGGSGGSGSGGSGDCPGAEAQKYKDLLTNSPSNSCSQIWAQQAVWHAYKCNCDRGMASASDANKMVANLNAIRTAIINLYKSGGNGSSTKCGATPPKVTKCNLL